MTAPQSQASAPGPEPEPTELESVDEHEPEEDGWDVEDDGGVALYCPGCGYQVNLLPAGPCPECGHAVDTNDLATVELHPPLILSPMQQLVLRAFRGFIAWSIILFFAFALAGASIVFVIEVLGGEM